MHHRGTVSQFIIWELDPVRLWPSFVGVPEAGHWTLLIIDRTVFRPGIAVFCDSLPSYEPHLFESLKERFCGTRAISDKTRWIRSSMPRQGLGTNNCGVWMCCIAAAYVCSLWAKNVLCPYSPFNSEHDGQGYPVNEVEQECQITNVSVSLGQYMTASSFGRMGREHMEKTLLNNRFDPESQLFCDLKVDFN